MDEVPTTFAQAEPVIRIRPLGSVPLAVRSTMIANAGGSESNLDASQPVAADILVGAYLDLPTSDVPVSWHTLQRWGVGLDAVIAAGREALARVQVGVTTIGSVRYVDDRSLAAAALLDPQIVAQLAPGIAPLVLVPTQQHLLIADTRSPEQVAQAADLAITAFTPQTRAVSVTPLAPSGGGWQPQPWPEQAGAAATKLQHYWRNAVYADAREHVKAAHERLGIEDVVVAGYQLSTNKDGHTRAVTSLVDSPGLRTFLPLADEVGLVTTDGAVHLVPMATVRAVPGLATPVPGLLPEYLEVARFPTELL